MKNLTKIVKALEGRGIHKSLYINLHGLSKDDVGVIIKKLPKELVMKECKRPDTNWFDGQLKDCEGFVSMQLNLFFKRDEEPL